MLCAASSSSSSSSFLKRHHHHHCHIITTTLKSWLASLWTWWGSLLLLLLMWPTTTFGFQQSSHEQKTLSSSSSSCKHVIILVHGYLGSPAELAYLQRQLTTAAATTTAATEKKKKKKDNGVYIYAARCNQGRTTDGIAAGGRRLAAEVDDLLGQLLLSLGPKRNEEQEQEECISLSWCGNSLGGLYARYAAAWITQPHRPGLFVTTCTPHLGCAGHTYVPLPAWGNWIVGRLLQQTGRDLFGQSKLLQELSTNDHRYTTALRSYAARMAYVNAYGTDFQVPTATAAFLDSSAGAGQEHYPVSTVGEEVLRVETRRRRPESSGKDNDSNNNNNNNMAQCLDDMGWTKVFFDVRPYLYPRLLVPRNTTMIRPLPPKSDEYYTSHQLLTTVASRPQWVVPVGHTVAVANAKNEFVEQCNAAGRPVMDQLAREIMAFLQDF